MAGANLVVAAEAPVGDRIARLAELPDDGVAGPADREDAVVRPVRDEEARDAALLARHDPARRERDHGGEEVAVRDAERQRVGGAVREAADRDPATVDRAALVRLGEREVDRLEVEILLRAEDAPGLALGRGRDQDEPGLVPGTAERVEGPRRRAAGAVEGDDERAWSRLRASRASAPPGRCRA